MHTGTHIFESREMDDIFLAARKENITSVFSGADDDYKIFDTADYSFCSSAVSDSTIVKFGIEQFINR